VIILFLLFDVFLIEGSYHYVRVRPFMPYCFPAIGKFCAFLAPAGISEKSARGVDGNLEAIHCQIIRNRKGIIKKAHCENGVLRRWPGCRAQFQAELCQDLASK